MKYLIAFAVLACTIGVFASPLDRIESDASIDEIKDEIYRILEDLEIVIPDNIQFPPRVKNKINSKIFVNLFHHFAV